MHQQHVIRLPVGTVVSRIFKRAGDVLAFGEPIAQVQTSSNASAAAQYLVSPIVGTLKQVNETNTGGDFAVFEGRKPSIGFRHVKHIWTNAAAADSAPAATTAAPPQQQQEVPPSFGRLPPLTDKETALLHSGLASEVW